MKSILKRALMRVLGSGPLLELKLRVVRESGTLTILNFHRVDDSRTSAYEAMRPDAFDQLVGWLRRHYTILTFGALPKRPPKPPLILSFDDGYRDFIEYVVPILDRHGVSANQNVIPGSVESGLPPMNVLMQDFIGQAPAKLLREVTFPGLPEGADPSRRVWSGLRASAAFKSRPIADQLLLFAQLRPHLFRFDGFRPTPMMNIAELREISSIHEIGTHSFEHATMSMEADQYVANDAVRCVNWHRTRLGQTPSIYAFPNGKARSSQIEIVKEAGFSHILLVGERFSSCDARVHQRITVHGTSRSELRARATGLMSPGRLEVAST